MVNAESVNQRQRPTHPMMSSLVDGITRENIQRRFETNIKVELQKEGGFFDWFEGLTYEELENICSTDITICQPIIEQILNNFIQIVDDDYDGVDYICDDWLEQIVDDDNNNPLHHICSNIIDNEIKLFISITQSAMLNTRVVYTSTCKTDILISYIGSIIYWKGCPWLKEWAQRELTRRQTEVNEDARDADFPSSVNIAEPPYDGGV